MSNKPFRAWVIGCGRMGQIYAEAFNAYPDTDLVAIAEVNAARRKAVGEWYGVTPVIPVGRLRPGRAVDIRPGFARGPGGGHSGQAIGPQQQRTREAAAGGSIAIAVSRNLQMGWR